MYRHREFVKEAVAANVVEVLFGIDDAKAILRTYRRRVPVNGGGREGVGSGIHDQRLFFSDDEACVYHPR